MRLICRGEQIMTTKQFYSYLYGLFGTDGSVQVTAENGETIYRLCLELIDSDILDQIATLLPDCTVTERTRNTNFKNEYHCFGLNCYNNDFLRWCEQNHFPLLNKTATIGTPNEREYDEDYFWYGVIDGDGSIGLKNNEQQPFINLTTDSEELKERYLDYIEKYTGFRPKVNRNKRDNIYNITLHGEKCLIIARRLFSITEIGIQRKKDKYSQICNWKKQDLSCVKRRIWTDDEVNDLAILSIDEFLNKYPNRTINSVKAKMARLKRR